MKTNLQANQTSRTQRGNVNVIRTIAAFVLVAVMTVGGINLRLITVEAAGVPAGYEPTIRAELGNNNPARTRDNFVGRCNGSPYYYNGRLYTRAEFFDAHHGGVFSMRSMPSREARDRFNQSSVWVATRQTGEASPPARLAGSEASQATPQPTPTPNSTQPPSQAAPDVVANSTGNGTIGQGQNVVSGGNNNDNQAVVAPNPAPSMPTASDRVTLQTMVEGRANASIVTVTDAQVRSGEVMDLFRAGIPVLLSDVQLGIMIESAPCVTETVSSLTAPFMGTYGDTFGLRRSTEAELQTWIDEYWEMGGFNTNELAFIRRINNDRVNNGVHRIAVCPNMMLATRMSMQRYLDLRAIGHRYTGHLTCMYGENTRLFGVAWRGGALGTNMLGNVSTTWQQATAPRHWAQTLDSDSTVMGIGSVSNAPFTGSGSVANLALFSN